MHCPFVCTAVVGQLCVKCTCTCPSPPHELNPPPSHELNLPKPHDLNPLSHTMNCTPPMNSDPPPPPSPPDHHKTTLIWAAVPVSTQHQPDCYHLDHHSCPGPGTGRCQVLCINRIPNLCFLCTPPPPHLLDFRQQSRGAPQQWGQRWPSCALVCMLYICQTQ